MKEIKLYRCEICGTQYNDKEKAKKCEKSHITDFKVTDMKFKPYTVDESGFPIKIEITTPDGQRADG